jgi:hypothetical protein
MHVMTATTSMPASVVHSIQKIDFQADHGREQLSAKALAYEGLALRGMEHSNNVP